SQPSSIRHVSSSLDRLHQRGMVQGQGAQLERELQLFDSSLVKVIVFLETLPKLGERVFVVEVGAKKSSLSCFGKPDCRKQGRNVSSRRGAAPLEHILHC